MPTIHGKAFWPGADTCEACTYTISQGISPGTALFRMSPNAGGRLPAEVGNLTFDDGANRVIIPDCKVQSIKANQDSGGQYWSLEIADRRWKWGEFGATNGLYNQLDPFGKLIPWTTRSPRELAGLLLREMGETRFTIDLPDGITRAQGAAFTRILRPGELFPPSGTNPCFNWEAEPPAKALQNLCDIFGRRIVYRLSTNSVLITIPGRGRTLPVGLSSSQHSPSVTAPDRPAGVGVIGSPTRYQMRMLLEPVGKEWDGSYRPIDELSYAPTAPGTKQISTATLTDFSLAINSYKVYVNDVMCFVITVPSDNQNTITTALSTAINVNPEVNKVVKATAAANVLTVTGLADGVAFKFETDVYPVPTVHEAKLVQVAKVAGRSWANCHPPTFWGVVETDRLTKYDAQKLAQESVWRCYRVVLADPTAPSLPLTVPGYGPLVRRQQIVLQDTQVEQVTPQANDPNLRNRIGQEMTVNLYNGYSRDKPAAVYGSAVTITPYALYLPTTTNTPQDKQYFAQFSANEFEQMIEFGSYVYRFAEGQYQKPKLTLQTGVLIRSAETNQLECYVASRPLGNASGKTNFLIKKYPDIQLNVIGTYDDRGILRGHRLLEEDAKIRAAYYLEGLALQFPVAAGSTENYNGFIPIDLDGAISQVTYNTDESGCSTVASRNTEHSVYTPPYPARRRAEGIPSVPVQRIAGALSKTTDSLISGLTGAFGGGK